MKTSPLPWTVESGMILDARRNIVATRWSYRHADKDQVRLDSETGISPVEADDNAHLIADAVNSYEWMRGFIEWIAENVPESYMVGVGTVVNVRNTARAVLAALEEEKEARNAAV